MVATCRAVTALLVLSFLVQLFWWIFSSRRKWRLEKNPTLLYVYLVATEIWLENLAFLLLVYCKRKEHQEGQYNRRRKLLLCLPFFVEKETFLAPLLRPSNLMELCSFLSFFQHFLVVGPSNSSRWCFLAAYKFHMLLHFQIFFDLNFLLYFPEAQQFSRH